MADPGASADGITCPTNVVTLVNINGLTIDFSDEKAFALAVVYGSQSDKEVWSNCFFMVIDTVDQLD